MRIDPDYADAFARPTSRLHSRYYADRGRVVASEDEDARATLSGRCHQLGRSCPEMPDIDRGAAGLNRGCIKLGGSDDTDHDAGMLKLVDESCCKQRFRARAEPLTPLIVSVRNRHHVNIHRGSLLQPSRSPQNQ
jgi:hypothetical protein